MLEIFLVLEERGRRRNAWKGREMNKLTNQYFRPQTIRSIKTFIPINTSLSLSLPLFVRKWMVLLSNKDVAATERRPEPEEGRHGIKSQVNILAATQTNQSTCEITTRVSVCRWCPKSCSVGKEDFKPFYPKARHSRPISAETTWRLLRLNRTWSQSGSITKHFLWSRSVENSTTKSRFFLHRTTDGRTWQWNVFYCPKGITFCLCSGILRG